MMVPLLLDLRLKEKRTRLMTMLNNLPLHRIKKIVIRESNHGVGETYSGVEFREIVFYDTNDEKFEVVAYGNEDEIITVEVK